MLMLVLSQDGIEGIPFHCFEDACLAMDGGMVPRLVVMEVRVAGGMSAQDFGRKVRAANMAVVMILYTTDHTAEGNLKAYSADSFVLRPDNVLPTINYLGDFRAVYSEPL